MGWAWDRRVRGPGDQLYETEQLWNTHLDQAAEDTWKKKEIIKRQVSVEVKCAFKQRWKGPLIRSIRCAPRNCMSITDTSWCILLQFSLGGFSENVWSLSTRTKGVLQIYIHCTFRNLVSFNAGLTLVGYKLSVKYKMSGNVCCPLKTN